MNVNEAQKIWDTLSGLSDFNDLQAVQLAEAIKVLNDKPKSIFTVTTTMEKQAGLVPKSRCWGFYHTEREARHAISENYGNMVDCLFTHLVLEEYAPGIIAVAKREVWFHYNEVLGEWLECDKPEFAVGVIDWAMG